MAYPIIPQDADDNNIKNLLFDIAERKEYYIFKPVENREFYDVRGFITPASMNNYLLNSNFVNANGLQLSAAQLFVRNFQNPNTEFSRLLINWQTGVGKSIAAISIGNEFIRQYRISALLGHELATVFIISFTAKETIREDMLKYPEFGFSRHLIPDHNPIAMLEASPQSDQEYRYKYSAERLQLQAHLNRAALIPRVFRGRFRHGR